MADNWLWTWIRETLLLLKCQVVVKLLHAGVYEQTTRAWGISQAVYFAGGSISCTFFFFFLPVLSARLPFPTESSFSLFQITYLLCAANNSTFFLSTGSMIPAGSLFCYFYAIFLCPSTSSLSPYQFQQFFCVKFQMSKLEKKNHLATYYRCICVF